MPKRHYFCDIHPMTELICPRCLGKKGGKATAKKYPTKMRKWARKGGRPKNKTGASGRKKSNK